MFISYHSTWNFLFLLKFYLKKLFGVPWWYSIRVSLYLRRHLAHLAISLVVMMQGEHSSVMDI